MNKKKKTVAVALLFASLLGVGAATAFVTQKGTGSTSGTVDQVVYLDWGTTQEVDSVSDLTDGNPAFRTIQLAAPVKSTSASGYGNPTFKIELTAGSGEKESLEGVSVSVAAVPWGKDVSAIGTAKVGQPYSVINDAEKTYYLKFEVTSVAYQKYVAQTIKMAGKATLSYTFVNAA